MRVHDFLLSVTVSLNQHICLFCREFGHKILQLKLIVKQLQKLLEDRDKNVREETKALVVEIYRWIGAAFMPQLTNLKPVQLTELQVEFDKVKEEGKPVQTRFLRSQQDLKEKLEQQVANTRDDGEGEECGDEEPDADMDPYDLMDPVNILVKLPKDFFDKIVRCVMSVWMGSLG